MAPSPPACTKGHTQILPIEEGLPSPYSTPRFRPADRRTPSSSPTHSWDSLSSFSFNEEFPPYSPTTPLKFSGIPFSWEQVPGIPKPLDFKKKESPCYLLPLPPAGNSTKRLQNQEGISPKKHLHFPSNRFQRDDPFFKALLACSKDDQEVGTNDGHIWKGSSRVSRILSDRIGVINMYSSCKRTCAVSESIVYLPRPAPSYLLNRRSG